MRPHPVFLKNPHNVCYLNATVTGLLWAGDRSRPSIYGAFAPAFRSLRTGTARRPIYVPGLLPWASLLHNWARLAQQQDASEFLAFLLHKLCSDAFAGTWAARLNDGDVIERRDQGAIPPPLPLTVPDQTQSVSLQQLLNDWHAQEATFALSKAPQFLFLQLKRYKQVGSEVCKLCTPVVLSPAARLSVPCFTGEASLDTLPATYKLCFAVAHEGANVHAGHYRCALAIDGDAPAFLLSDDSVAAKPLKTTQRPWLETNCYLVCLQRV